MILTEFDGRKDAVINPEMLISKREDFPPVTVSCFSHKLFDSVLACFDAKKIAELSSADGDRPVYEVVYQGRRFALYHSLVGEPSCVADYEDLLAMGSRMLILAGNCGVLDASIEDCGIIIPTQAIRDEGCSYHYAPPADTIPVNGQYRELFKQVLTEHGYPFVEGTTWTTDAPYRETREKVERRKAAGAICVEMECAGMQALADFRKTGFFQYLYAGDNLDCDDWEPRSLSGSLRLDDKTKILFLAFEFGLRLMQLQEETLTLVEPDLSYADRIMAYRKAFLDSGESLDGTSGLRKCENAAEWLDMVERKKRDETCPPGRMASTQYLYVRASDGQIVGMLDIRHRLNEGLLRCGGHIGYSIHPSERRKGYAKRMLADALPLCRQFGIEKALVTCDDWNEGSRRTILANGGVHENTLFVPEENGMVERYWIEVPKPSCRKPLPDPVAFCGLNCEACDAYRATVNDDPELRRQTAERWSELNGVPITPEQINCEGCRGTGVKTVFCERMCPVRKCATGKGFLSCGDCPDFPGCGTVGQILQHDEQAKQRLEGRKAQLERIRTHEALMDEAERILNAGRLAPGMRERLETCRDLLEAYYTSPEWKQDFADDEAGLLPPGLKRGVLSEDGIDRLVDRIDDSLNT